MVNQCADMIAKAAELHDQGLYREAIEILSEAVRLHDPCAHYLLGLTYLYGHGTTPDRQSAARWLSEAARLGVRRAETLVRTLSWKVPVIPEQIDLNVNQNFRMFLTLRNRSADVQYLTGLHCEFAKDDALRQGAFLNAYFSAALDGSADAQARLGTLFRTGGALPQDHGAAAFWYTLASEQDHAAATFDLGNYYRFGLFFEKDEQRAMELYERAAGLGEPHGQYALGEWLLTHADGGARQRGLQLLHSAADAGLTLAQSLLGRHLLDAAPLDYGAALRLLTQAADAGDVDAECALGYAIMNGIGCPQDLVQGSELLRRAVNSGHPHAQFLLAQVHLHRIGTERSLSEARRLLELGADQGHPGCLRMLGEMYESGAEVTRDSAMAALLYERAAAAGDTIASFNLGTLYEHGDGVPVNRRKSAEYVQRAAETGHASAMFNLGNLHLNGIDGEKDYELARTWLERAAAAGHGRALTSLACIYELGLGVGEDKQRATTLFLQSVAKCTPTDAVNAQYNLGIKYRDGCGVDQDDLQACTWFRKAAEGGFAPAQIELALMLWQGKGCSLSREEAFMWALLGKRGGDERGERAVAMMQPSLKEHEIAEALRRTGESR